MHTMLEAENNMNLGRNKMLELIKAPRNRRAMLASQIVMFMQQVSVDFQRDTEVIAERTDLNSSVASTLFHTILPRYFSRSV